MPSKIKSILSSAALAAVSVAVSLGAAEGILRIKNASMTNYDIEMWRYAKELKIRSDDPALDFDHLKSKSAVLENVAIRLNDWGLRGGPIAPAPGRRILFLGGSITLGWGVAEEDTVEARLEKMLAGQKAEVLNGGVGNYNAERYVSRFFHELTGLKPTDIVVHYFLRDAEDLPPGGGNFLLRHSELAVTLWIAAHRTFDKSGEASLVEHYRQAYRPDAPGFLKMKDELKKLADYAKENGIRIYLAMVPDVHDLIDYKFAFVHDIMRRIAETDGYTYIDLLPALQGRPPQELWAMPGDPHPNALGHEAMAQAIFPAIAKTGESPSGR
jgi:lysophospholipase L1-like esterase